MDSAKDKQTIYDIKFSDNTAMFEKDILKENSPKLSYLIRLFKYVFSSAKLICAIFLGLAIILSILQPIMAFIWAKYIDNANDYLNMINPQSKQLVSLIGLASLYWFFGLINNMIYRYIYGSEDIERLSKVQDNHLKEKFQTKLFEKISRLYPDYMEVPKINDIIKRSFDSMGTEWSSLQRGVIIEGYVIIARVVSVIMVAASLYIFHPLLCLIVLVAPIPTLYTTYIGNKLTFKFSRDNGKIMRKANYYQDVLLGSSAKEVKALNLFDFFFNKWKTHSDDYLVKEMKNQTNVFLIGLLSGLISNIGSVISNVFAIILMTQGKLSLGALGAVLVLIDNLMNSTSKLFSSVANFISKKNEAAQFFELIDLNEQNLKDKSIDIDIEKLEVQNISYRYPLTDEYRIKNVNFTINKGEKVAFVGENGAGKTTFIKLLTGMLEPSSGNILINGDSIFKGFENTIEHISKNEDENEVENNNANSNSNTDKNMVKNTYYFDRYNSSSYVFQEPAKFNTFTVADNVFLGDVLRNRDESQIEKALDFSGIEGINKDAMLGKDIGGTDLSGGQWQKIAIARAYYRNRDIIILDEPTSNLDPLAETEIFKKYMAMAENKTVIVVTHRISVASLADRVVVFKNGEIVEDGSHESLLANDGEYTRLYSTQSKWYHR